jgi:tRNA A-37 threonylcarbamoyl transferase component Bud32
MFGQALPRLRTELKPVVPSRKPFSKVRSRYKGLQRIGEGSFGTVYRAVLDDKKVIIKVAHSSGRAGFSTMVITRGMIDEIRILIKLQKFPFVPRLIEIGTDYFTTEDVDGISMSDELKAGMTELKGLSIVVATAVMASLLHRDGIAHNDIHPGNILLTPNGVVLIDFGTAIDRAHPAPSGIGKREDFRDGIKYDISYLLDIIDIFTNWPDWPKQLINTLVPLKNGYRGRLERGEYDEETGIELARELGFIVAQLGAIRKIESISGLSGETLVHYSRDPFKTLRPLTYEELVKDRIQGRWENQPDMAKKYVDERKVGEERYGEVLKKLGLPYDPKTSFLYYTFLGKHFLKWAKGRYEHRIPLTPEIIRETFFDVVGLPKEANKTPLPEALYGKKGLALALRLWKKYKSRLKPYRYMGMTIHPRVEIFTQKIMSPEIWKDGTKVDGLGVDPNEPAPHISNPATGRIQLLLKTIDDAETTASWESDVSSAKEKLLKAWMATKAVMLDPVSELERSQAQELLDRHFPYAVGTITMAAEYIKEYGRDQGRPDIETIIRDSFSPPE